MTPGQLKGTVLEYLIRQLLQNCGFASVRPDGHYIYEQNGTGLFFINGKGAAHDADVLMEPPIQLPFSYPSRLLFECKAYQSTIGLNIVRNALGLRYDINEFEIVTDESIERRKNNRRANYAISDRKRFNYQVGVATVEQYSPSAFEFAANNKIPLFSLRWFLPQQVCDLFHDIDLHYLNSIPDNLRRNLYSFLKNKERDASYRYDGVNNFIRSDRLIGEIIRRFRSVIDRTFIGLIETGDLIFLYSQTDDNFNFLYNQRRFDGLRAQIHYYRQRPNEWLLELIDNSVRSEFRFIVPDRIMRMWRDYSLDKNVAIDLKERFFSRIFIFTRYRNEGLPFVVVNIDREWLDNIREQ